MLDWISETVLVSGRSMNVPGHSIHRDYAGEAVECGICYEQHFSVTSLTRPTDCTDILQLREVICPQKML